MVLVVVATVVPVVMMIVVLVAREASAVVAVVRAVAVADSRKAIIIQHNGVRLGTIFFDVRCNKKGHSCYKHGVQNGEHN